MAFHDLSKELLYFSKPQNQSQTLTFTAESADTFHPAFDIDY